MGHIWEQFMIRILVETQKLTLKTHIEKMIFMPD